MKKDRNGTGRQTCIDEGREAGREKETRTKLIERLGEIERKTGGEREEDRQVERQI